MEDRVFVVLVIFLIVPFLFICLICIYCNTTVEDFRKDANTAAKHFRKDMKAFRKDADTAAKHFREDVEALKKDANTAVERLSNDANAVSKGLSEELKGLRNDAKPMTESFFDRVLDWIPRLFKSSRSNSNIALMPSKSKASDAYRMVSQEDVPFGII